MVLANTDLFTFGDEPAEIIERVASVIYSFKGQHASGIRLCLEIARYQFNESELEISVELLASCCGKFYTVERHDSICACEKTTLPHSVESFFTVATWEKGVYRKGAFKPADFEQWARHYKIPPLESIFIASTFADELVQVARKILPKIKTFAVLPEVQKGLPMGDS